MKPFDYYEAGSLEEAVEILASGEEIRAMAGGCGILLLMKEKVYFPEGIVNIKKIPDLKYVKGNNGEIHIGPLSTHNEVKDAPLVRENLPLLSEALGFVANNRIRNMATLGGTLAHADPTSDAAPALLALEGRVRVLGKGGERDIPLTSFFQDYFETTLEPTDVIREVILPVSPGGAGAVYTRFQVRKAMDKAMPGIAVLIHLEDDGRTIAFARIGLSGVGNKSIRLPEAEDFLKGKEDHPEIRRELGNMVKEIIDPVDEYHYSTEYKKEIASVYLQRSVSEAYKRAQGKS